MILIWAKKSKISFEIFLRKMSICVKFKRRWLQWIAKAHFNAFWVKMCTFEKLFLRESAHLFDIKAPLGCNWLFAFVAARFLKK